jgi:hypothetical protein
MVPWIYISFFAHPIADDYNYAVLSRKSSFLQEYIRQYFIWNGRYTSNILVLLNPISFGSLSAYQWIPICLIAITLGSFYVFIKAIFKTTFTWIESLALSLSATLLFVYLMPSPAEGFYWYTGAVTYQTANALSLIYLTLMVRYFYQKTRMSKMGYLILASLILVLIIGLNETILLMILLFQSLFLVFANLNRASQKNMMKVAILLLVLAMVASMVVIFAPGNVYRAARYSGSHNLFHSLLFTGFQTLRFSIDWVSNIPFLFLSFLYLPLHYKIKKSGFFKGLSCPVWFASGLLFFILVVGIFPSYWNTNILGQYRTVNTSCFFFILGWFLNLSCWINFFEERGFYWDGSLLNRFKYYLITIILIALVASKNGYKLGSDIIYNKVKCFDKEMNFRDEQMVLAWKNGLRVAHINTLKNKPEVLFVMDLCADSTTWVNTSYATFFGLKKVEVKKME